MYSLLSSHEAYGFWERIYLSGAHIVLVPLPLDHYDSMQSHYHTVTPLSSQLQEKVSSRNFTKKAECMQTKSYRIVAHNPNHLGEYQYKDVKLIYIQWSQLCEDDVPLLNMENIPTARKKVRGSVITCSSRNCCRE